MAVSARVVSIEMTATVICDGTFGTTMKPASVYVKNTSVETIYLGGSAVDSTDGLPIDSGAGISFDLIGETLYGICGSEVDVNCLFSGVAE